MQLIRRLLLFTILFGALFSRPALAAEPLPPLPGPPLGEHWFGITMGDERVGFARTAIRAAAEGYEVSAAGSSKMVVLGFAREASGRETYLVNRDLSLHSFAVEQTIDGKQTRLTGEVTAKGVKVTVESAAGRRVQTLKARGKVYPPPLLNLYPLIRGSREGRKQRLQIFDPEEVRLKEVTITSLGRETLPGGVETVHLRNDLYPFVDNDIWVDLAGNTVRESVRDGLIVTSAEDAAAARKFIVEAAIAKRELILAFSLVRTDRPIARPAELQQLTLELAGLPEDLPLVSRGGQKAVRLAGGSVLFTMERPPAPPQQSPAAADMPGDGSAPEPGGSLAADEAELLAQKNEIAGEETEPVRLVEKLARWVAANVAESAADDLPPLETLRARKGNCQSRVRLYAALARAAAIPTRIVVGLVYQAGKGFAYHSWAESRLEEWLAVDPSLGQVPADATHITLADGESREALADVVGRVTAKVVEETY